MHNAQQYQPVKHQHHEFELQGRNFQRGQSMVSDTRTMSNSTLNDAVDDATPGTDQASRGPSKEIHKNTTTGNRHSTGMTWASTTSSKSTPSTGRHLRFLRDWWLEIIGCFFIIGAIIAIFATANAYQNRPLPSWPHGITLNSVIAIYVVVLKAAVILILAQGLSHLKWTWFTKSRPLNDLARYDNASRGPLGSIALLWSLRGRDLLSSLGAVAIIAAVVLDPMAQQVIRYWNCPQTLSGRNATIARTNAYMETGLHLGAGLSTMPLDLQAAINGGVYVPGALTVAYDCSTGNCTFPESFSTVGFASHCDDVTNELRFANVTGTYNYNYTEQVANSTATTTRVVTQNYTLLNATLPSTLSTSYSITAGMFTTYMSMAFNSSTNVFELIRGPRTMNPSPRDNFCSNGTTCSSWNRVDYGAVRCKIDPAIFAINSKVESGKLQENIVMQTKNFSTAGTSASVVDVTCLNRTQQKALSDLGYVLPRADEVQWLPYNVSVYSNYTDFIYQTNTVNASESIKRIVPVQCIYQVSLISVMSMGYFFRDYLTGSIVPLGEQWTGSSATTQFYQSRGVDFESVNSMFENITRAMTTHVRTHGWANNSAPATGQIIHSETCITVRWAWLTFPAALAVITLLFFAAMVFETKRAQHGVHHDFKSSPLALLFHGLDDHAQRRLEKSHMGESNEVQDLSHEAKSMFVRLQPTQKGWRFVTDGNGAG